MLAIPLIIKVGIPLGTYAIGHVVGWFHRKHVDKKLVAQVVQSQGAVNKSKA